MTGKTAVLAPTALTIAAAWRTRSTVLLLAIALVSAAMVYDFISEDPDLHRC